MTSGRPEWPAVSLDETYRILTAPGAPFEMETIDVAGRPVRVYKKAHRDLRTIFEASKTWGDRTFIVFENERLSFTEHYRAASALARRLAEDYGVKKGDRVAIAMRNFPEWPIAFWAATIIGAIAVPLNAWGTGEDLAYGLRDSGASIAVVDGERLARLKPLMADHAAALIAVRAAPETLGEATALEDLIGAPSQYGTLPDRASPDRNIHPDDDATILYTSGTTGRSKGALGTHRNIMCNLVNITFSGARAAIRRGDPLPAPQEAQKAVLLPVPFFHVTGCHSIMIPALANGSKIVLMYKWNAEAALELIERERINGMSGVPSMTWQLLESPDFERRDVSSLEGLSYGGAAASPELTRKVAALFPGKFGATGYGATETSSVSTSNGAEDYLAHPDSVGPAVPGCDLRVIDDAGNTLPIGAIGELEIYGGNVVKGYWINPQATAAAFHDGWYRTGDIVRMDAEGFVYLLDRAKDMLIRGGENVYCVEIEDALLAHPDIFEAAIVGIPDRVLGELVGAVVRARAGSGLTADQVIEHLRPRLAAFKLPVHVDIRVDELPRTASGKIVKRQLREELAAKASTPG
ncbi:class I adenylate-forming enzyme family protein [Bradyrhizobium sp. CCGE-LA001]|uniref:class I adenylate-forming enzyme family protein n=1 Tax=Bradyrhizobium sp. CCGE-LA001 TaxID=1223566 RepID=UPI000745E199|nr:class I adenylate-forming enzyme family protein [Bradyrhizobium sp. CCGE-LA001]AMA57403.1 fatty acid--CoA ligase [Bradyrhizobium sp. CCGE-LA001]